MESGHSYTCHQGSLGILCCRMSWQPWYRQAVLLCHSNTTSSWSIRRPWSHLQDTAYCKNLWKCKCLWCLRLSSRELTRNILELADCHQWHSTQRRKEWPQRGRGKMSTSSCIYCREDCGRGLEVEERDALGSEGFRFGLVGSFR
jgi:hypothetical protein